MHRLIKDIVKSNAAQCASPEATRTLIELFSVKGRFDEQSGIKQAERLKIFRSHVKGQPHKDFIAANRIYTDEENAMLNDFEQISASDTAGAVFQILA